MTGSTVREYARQVRRRALDRRARHAAVAAAIAIGTALLMVVLLRRYEMGAGNDVRGAWVLDRLTGRMKICTITTPSCTYAVEQEK